MNSFTGFLTLLVFSIASSVFAQLGVGQLSSELNGSLSTCERLRIERIATLATKFKVTNSWERVFVTELTVTNGFRLAPYASTSNFVSTADMATKDVHVITILPPGPVVLSERTGQTNVWGRISVVPPGYVPAVRMNIRPTEAVGREVQVPAPLPGQTVRFEQNLIKAR